MIGWLDCSAGISGDMLLGALVDTGVPLDRLQEAVDAVGVEPVRLVRSDVVRAGIGACKVDVDVGRREVTQPGSDTPRGGPPGAGTPARRWADLRALLETAPLAEGVRTRALAVFARLAAAEAGVHRVAVEDVHFHEVGALDAVADVVGGAAGLEALGLTSLTASVVTVGSGTARGAHGALPVPPPAVLALLAGVPVQAGPVAREMTTPTGAALLVASATGYGPLPPMTVQRTGSGAGGRDPEELPNVLRLVLGEPLAGAGTAPAVVLSTNVDDLDPRLWPGVLDALLAAGADDAWLTPILMKKGRPAQTLSVLCGPGALAAVREVVFRQTSTLGLREQAVGKTALDRVERTVDVGGQRVRVKLGLLGEEVVNAMPEWEDVAAAAAALGRPAKLVLRDAHAAASALPA